METVTLLHFINLMYPGLSHRFFEAVERSYLNGTEQSPQDEYFILLEDYFEMMKN